jgi:penicillin-binding protein 2
VRQHKYQVSIQRILWISAGQAVFFVLIICRLFILQVMQSDKYAILSDDNRIRTRIMVAQRGELLDRSGQLLTKNVENYSAVIIPEDLEDLNKTLKNLKGILDLSDEDMQRIKRSIRQKPRFVPTIIKDELTWDQLSKVEVHSLNIPGVSIEQGFRRHYPLGKAGAHVIGYVASPNEGDVQNNKTLIMSGAKIGKAGLEARYEENLRGIDGQKVVEVDAHGRVVRELKNIPFTAGKDLPLTIDKDLQTYIAEVFEEQGVESGAAIVLDAYTGEILSLVSIPGFNPDLFYYGIDSKSWKSLLRDPYKPMTNKAVAGQYSPASIFKIIVALAALEAGHPLYESYSCPGHYYVGKHKFHCWKKEGHGSVDLYQALVKSCDVYFYTLARKIGEKPIIEMARRFGLSTITGIDLPNEVAGFLADPQWKKRVRKENWYTGDTILTAIGQAYVLSTPLQMAVMMAQVVNGGQKIVPTFIKKEQGEQKYMSINSEMLATVLKALGDVVNSPGGTSYASRITEAKYAIGGKTGTAMVRRISLQERQNGIRKDKDIPWHLRDNALFVGFAPVDAPRYVVALVAEHKGFGGMAAAPIGTKILYKTQKLMEEGGEK